VFRILFSAAPLEVEELHRLIDIALKPDWPRNRPVLRLRHPATPRPWSTLT